MVYMIAVVIVTAVCLHYLVCVCGGGGVKLLYGLILHVVFASAS